MKWSGHSIIETVVSMTIASIVFSLGFMIYLNVVQSIDQDYQVMMQVNAQYHLDSLSATAEPTSEYSYDTEGGLSVYYVAREYEPFDQAFLVTCYLTDSIGYEVETRKIIHNPGDEAP